MQFHSQRCHHDDDLLLARAIFQILMRRETEICNSKIHADSTPSDEPGRTPVSARCFCAGPVRAMEEKDIDAHPVRMGSLFGCDGPPSPKEQIDAILRQEHIRLLAAALAKPRRGARIKDWRLRGRDRILKFMNENPQIPKAKIAQVILYHPNGPWAAGVRDVRVIQNWLSEISKGRAGYGRAKKTSP